MTEDQDLFAGSEKFLTEPELIQIEKIHADGLTSAQIMQIFRARGIRLSEPTFRKYVQLGLLPRSRRVGSKGKHRGSHGVYPCATVRRINDLKRLMASSFTIEEIQQSLTSFKREIDAMESSLEQLFVRFERELAQPRFDTSLKRSLAKDIDEARQIANDLVRQVIQIDSRVSLPTKMKRSAGEGMLTDIRFSG